MIVLLLFFGFTAQVKPLKRIGGVTKDRDRKNAQQKIHAKNGDPYGRRGAERNGGDQKTQRGVCQMYDHAVVALQKESSKILLVSDAFQIAFGKACKAPELRDPILPLFHS